MGNVPDDKILDRMKRTGYRVTVAGLFAALLMTSAQAAGCGPGDVGDIDMSCNGLWQERNRIFAEHGYCFKSARAIRTFGSGCFPPYGHLSHSERCYIAGLEQLERKHGCASE